MVCVVFGKGVSGFLVFCAEIEDVLVCTYYTRMVVERMEEVKVLNNSRNFLVFWEILVHL